MRTAKLLLAFFLTVLICKSSSATGLYGGEITFSHSSGNTYNVQLQMFYDSQAPSATQLGLQYTSGNCGGGSLMLFRTNLSPNNNNCGPYLSSVATYTGQFSIPNNCSSYVFTYDNCCRSALVSNISNSASISTIFKLNIVNNMLNNSSPEFTQIPIIHAPSNQTINFSFAASDIDGDSLSYHLVPTPSAVYQNGFSATNPFGNSSTVLNSQNGDVQFTSPTSGQYVIVVEVREYRNGVLLSRITREVLVLIDPNASNNHVPVLSGFNGTNQYSTALCAGNTLNAFALVSDPDPDTVLATVVGNSYGASIAQIGDTLFIEWVTDTSDARNQAYPLTIRLDDQNCGIVTYTLNVTLNNCLSTSLESVHMNEEFSVYPNPASSFFRIADLNKKSVELSVYDQTGKVVIHKPQYIQGNKVNTDVLKPGLYFLKLVQDEQEVIKKLLIQ